MAMVVSCFACGKAFTALGANQLAMCPECWEKGKARRPSPFGSGKTVLSARLADGRDIPPIPDTVLGTDETRWARTPASERHVVEGVACDASDFDTRYDVRVDGDDSTGPVAILDVLAALLGRRVRVVVEVVG